jgi:hypothetical protein
LLGLVSCVGPSAVTPAVTHPEPAEPTPREPPGPPVEAAVLVALDGVRWQDALDASRMPFLADIGRTKGARLGARGAAFVASGPHYVSLPGYVEMLSGRTVTGCKDNDRAAVRFATLPDEVAARGDEAAVFASWERLERAASAGGEVLVSADAEVRSASRSTHGQVRAISGPTATPPVLRLPTSRRGGPPFCSLGSASPTSTRTTATCTRTTHRLPLATP